MTNKAKSIRLVGLEKHHTYAKGQEKWELPQSLPVNDGTLTTHDIAHYLRLYVDKMEQNHWDGKEATNLQIVTLMELHTQFVASLLLSVVTNQQISKANES